VAGRKELLWLLGLFVVGVGYGLLGSGLSLDWVDEGQIIYLSWRVAEGALPYRDFQNIYGPSVFFLNGSLFRLFGEDLWVTRVSLTVLKAGLAVVVYLCTLRLGPRPVALGAWLLCIVVWGLPWPYLTTPYPNFYGVSLSMGGLLVLARFRGTGRQGRGYVLAGLCFGLAATFKQTNGLFAYCAVILHLVSLRSETLVPGGLERLGARVPDRAVGASRWLVLAACGVLFAVYLARANTPANFVLLIAPAVVALLALAIAELRSPATREVRTAALCSMLLLSLGAGLPILLVSAYFALHGLLPALAYNTVFGLPQKIEWLVPLPTFGWEAGLFALGLFGIVLSIRRGIADPSTSGNERGLSRGSLAVGLIALCAVVLGLARQGQNWVFPAADLVIVVFFLLVWGSLLVTLRSGSGAEQARLFALYGATAVLFLYPSADAPHALLSLPAVLPLLACCLVPGRARGEASSDGRSSYVSALAIAALASPFVYLQVVGRLIERVPRPSFERASGIEVTGEFYRDGTRLVRYLDQEGLSQRPLLVISGKPMAYFLAGRPSLVDPFEYALYLIGLGVLTGEDARELVDEEKLIEVLRTAHPLLVTDSSDDGAARVAQALPRVRAEVEEHFEVLSKIGLFSILEPRSEAGRGRDR
jgi:hypothetical protein